MALYSFPSFTSNQAPTDLNSAELTVAESQPIGTIVGEFDATDREGDAITYHLVSGIGDGNNSLFTLDQNGTLKTAAVLDYEAGSSLSIRVQAKDEINATTEGNFTVTLTDIFEDLDGDGIEDHLDEDMDEDGYTNDLEVDTGSDSQDADSTPLNYGLVAWYPFDGNASDMSSNHHHGIIQNEVLPGVDRNEERKGAALTFDGIDDFISVPHHQDFNHCPLAASAWFKSEQNSSGGKTSHKQISKCHMEMDGLLVLMKRLNQ